jgi:hypothetical protein
MARLRACAPRRTVPGGDPARPLEDHHARRRDCASRA